MLYFIHGTDREKIKAKQRDVLATLRAKRPNSNFVVLDNENFSEAKLDELIMGGGLFDEKHIVAINNLFSDKQWESVLTERVEGMAKSVSAFVCIDEKIDAKVLKEIEKHAYKVLHVEKKEKTKAWGDESAILFTIGDAVGEKDRMRAWALFQKALRKNFSAEEIHGTVFWQVKSIAIAKHSKSANESGMSSFVFQKSSRYAKNFSEQELCDTLHSLVSLYHNSRTEDSESLEIALEKFLLEK